ncbi:hypothetical protein HHK36_030255 [Tetracentron sinense]|uniref:Uncharacterized protein n=1 Tax=Tetracentron sinense TaxID=13715 RepID=A0A834YB52_TETSI|nr:hypothetical protein HHK36_030255 [Tetracentron sinense]
MNTQETERTMNFDGIADQKNGEIQEIEAAIANSSLPDWGKLFNARGENQGAGHARGQSCLERLRKVARLQMNDVAGCLAERGIALAVSDAALDIVLEESNNPAK